MRTSLAIGIVVGIILLPFLVHATQNQTTMGWVTLYNRGFNTTYGGNCSDSNFYFKETDANFDPDIDGNAAKVKPSASPGTNPPASTQGNERYTTFSVPCASTGNNCAFDVNTQTSVPTSANTHDAEFVNAAYNNIDIIDSADANTSANVAGRFPAQQYVFKLLNAVHPLRIFDLNFVYFGSSVWISNAANCADGTGSDRDLNIYAYNYATAQYDLITRRTGTQATYTGDAGYQSEAYLQFPSYTVPNYVGNGPDYNITFLVKGQINTSNGRHVCLITDRVFLFYKSYDESSNYCQSSTVAPMTIRNTGNTTINLDGNFSSAFTGVDSNIVLKVWRGGPFCGNTGFGGWEATCSVTNPLLPVTTTTCKNFNKFNATTSTRLITSIVVDANNQLCFSGDFNGFVPGGEHAKEFNTITG